jgi:hypothetical protein
MDWKQFEEAVGDVFRMMGYEVQANVGIQSAQTDLLATTPTRLRPNLLIECKYHADPKTRVSIDEIENFAARVLRLRIEGVIDHGYLVTNTGFSSQSKGNIFDSSAKNFVFPRTYNELLHRLLDTELYLKEYVRRYEESRANHRFVDLWCVSANDLRGTDFDRSPFEPHIRSVPTNPRGHDATVIFVPVPLTRAQVEHLAVRLGVHGQNLASGSSCLVPVGPDADKTVDRISQEIQATLTAPVGPNIAQQFRDALSDDGWHRYRRRGEFRPYYQRLGEFGTNTGVAQATHFGLYSIEPCTSRLVSFLDSSESQLAVVLGDFGSGKTTTLRHLMYLLAKKKLANPTDPATRTPLLISLRDYNKVPDFDAMIVNFLNNEAGVDRVSLPVFRRLNELGHFTLVLDGFDEMAKLVTAAERYLTFNAICGELAGASKMILSGRPGYFPDSDSMVQSIAVGSGLCPVASFMHGRPARKVDFTCVQLMGEDKITEYLEKHVDAASSEAIAQLTTRDGIADLARRPVLTNMIIESIPELSSLPSDQINLSKLYETYIEKWTKRELTKGYFRLLINRDQKEAFLALLAIQMHFTDSLQIHYRELDVRIKAHFGLQKADEIDHFSHDIRTCSFLNSDDHGNYKFIHKSFMEFLVAREFSRCEASIYKGEFERPITDTMLKQFLVRMTLKPALQQPLELAAEIDLLKEAGVWVQDFEFAAGARDWADRIRRSLNLGWPSYTDTNNFHHMARELFRRSTTDFNRFYSEIGKAGGQSDHDLAALIDQVRRSKVGELLREIGLPLPPAV